VHSKGLKFGIYRDRHEGLGHEEADAKQYAAWKCDYVKNDGYGNSSQAYSGGLTATQVYARFRDAVNATGRPMLLNVKFDVEPEGFSSASEIANTWRVGRDVRPVWADVVRLADIAAPLAHLSHPGGFSDLDSLEVGERQRSQCTPLTTVRAPPLHA
jgi:alpha-galactosidase